MRSTARSPRARRVQATAAATAIDRQIVRQAPRVPEYTPTGLELPLTASWRLAGESFARELSLLALSDHALIGEDNERLVGLLAVVDPNAWPGASTLTRDAWGVSAAHHSGERDVTAPTGDCRRRRPRSTPCIRTLGSEEALA
jgi:hypothetical protein